MDGGAIQREGVLRLSERSMPMEDAVEIDGLSMTYDLISGQNPISLKRYHNSARVTIHSKLSI